MEERKNSKERRGGHLGILIVFPALVIKEQNDPCFTPPQVPAASSSCAGFEVGFRWSKQSPHLKGKQEQLGVSEIREITPQIKTFYQPLIAVQTNYILAKLCQWLPRGIIIKFWAWKCVPILSTSGCFSCRNQAPAHFSAHDVLCINWHLHTALAGRVMEGAQLYLKTNRGCVSSS